MNTHIRTLHRQETLDAEGFITVSGRTFLLQFGLFVGRNVRIAPSTLDSLVNTAVSCAAAPGHSPLLDLILNRAAMPPDQERCFSFLQEITDNWRWLCIGIGDRSVVDERVSIAHGTSIGHDCRISRKCEIGFAADLDAGVCLEPAVFIGNAARIGAGCRIPARTHVPPHCVIARRSPLKPKG